MLLFVLVLIENSSVNLMELGIDINAWKIYKIKPRGQCCKENLLQA